jgi:EAL domain-containing protein (putative c-di-GMP-specific phosphodiesterase class I)
MGHFVLEEACRQIALIRQRLGLDLPIAVNLSPRQFQQSSLLADVATALDRAGLESELLKFEITETMVMDDMGGATEIMKKLNRLGVRLAIDDFGTGHSSLGYIKNFPVHEVKVDRLFVQNLATDPVDYAIVRAVVDLADAMRIGAVAEGVETTEQLEGLRRIGCHLAQGYLFSRPVPGEALIDLLDRHSAARPHPAHRRPGLRVV